MKYLFQIFTGDLSEHSLAKAEPILEKLRPFAEAGKLAGVLCGWSRDLAFYQTLRKTLTEWKVPLLFKTAVFSELEGEEGLEPMWDYEGHPMEPYVLNPQEHFLFRCPSSEINRSRIVELFDREFAGVGFDGIFLDRIRYSSMLGGIPGIGGCFCPRCVKRYEAEGLDVDRVRRALRLAAEEKKLELVNYENGRWQVMDADLDAFFRVRTQILTEAVTYFAEAFHARGLKIGLDLFSPVFGYFAGQDVLALSEKVDFIKPMIYRFTEAPAGLPFEKEAFLRVTGREAEKLLPGFSGMAEEGDSKNLADSLRLLADRELKRMALCGCSVYPGMEVNNVEPIVSITPDRVRDEVALLKENGFDRMVPAWDLNRMPGENLEVLLAN